MFGEILRKLRKERGITQEELARIIGVERSSIGKYEGKSKVLPSDEVKQRIAEFFGVSMDFLFGLEPTQVKQSTSRQAEILGVDEIELLSLFRDLNAEGKGAVIQHARICHGNPRLLKDALVAMAK